MCKVYHFLYIVQGISDLSLSFTHTQSMKAGEADATVPVSCPTRKKSTRNKPVANICNVDKMGSNTDESLNLCRDASDGGEQQKQCVKTPSLRKWSSGADRFCKYLELWSSDFFLNKNSPRCQESLDQSC